MPGQDTDRTRTGACLMNASCVFKWKRLHKPGWDTDRKGIGHGLMDPQNSIHSPSDGRRRSGVSASALLCSSEEKL